MTGLQGPFQGRYGSSVRDLGEVPAAPVFRTRIDWYVGFGVMHLLNGDRPMTRLKATAQFSLLASHPGHSAAVTVVLHLAPELRDGTMGTFVL